MKELLVIRKETSVQGCFGTAFGGDEYTWASGAFMWVDENKDEIRDANVSSMPRGDYTLRWTRSPGRSAKAGHDVFVYQVVECPGGVAIQYHKANFFGQRRLGWDSDVLGCEGFGKSVGELRNSSGRMQKALIDSGIAMAEFEKWGNGEDIKLTITEQFPGVAEVSPENRGA